MSLVIGSSAGPDFTIVATVHSSPIATSGGPETDLGTDPVAPSVQGANNYQSGNLFGPTDYYTPPSADNAALSDSVTVTGSFNLALADTTFPGTTDTATFVLTRPDISDYQFVIDTAPWTPFGVGRDIFVSKFDPGSFDTRNQDVSAVNADYRVFGTDRKTPPTWSFEMTTTATTAVNGLGWVDSLARVWDDDVRQSPNGTLALRYGLAGRKRRVYGRPRRFTPVVGTMVRAGRVDIVADFALAEDVYYDDDIQTITLPITPVVLTYSGVILPQPLPWHFTQAAPPVTQQAIVGGTQSTWFIAKITGPISTPWFRIGSLTWQLTGSIPVGQSVTISGRPWDSGVRFNDGSYRPGMLDPRSRLSQLRMPPGTYGVQFGGFQGSGGGANCVLSWRNAYRSL